MNVQDNKYIMKIDSSRLKSVGTITLSELNKVMRSGVKLTVIVLC